MREWPYSVEEVELVANGAPMFDWEYVRELLKWSVWEMRRSATSKALVLYVLVCGLALGAIAGWVLCVLFRVRPILEACR